MSKNAESLVMLIIKPNLTIDIITRLRIKKHGIERASLNHNLYKLASLEEMPLFSFKINDFGIMPAFKIIRLSIIFVIFK